MLRVSQEIRISAPAERVWGITTDIQRWPSQLPKVTAARPMLRQPFGRGSQYEVKQPLQRAAIWQVTKFAPGRGFTWQRFSGLMLSMTACHDVLAEGEESVCRLSLVCRGPLAFWLRPILRPLFRVALASENAALKARCEAELFIDCYLSTHPHTSHAHGVDAT